jgi:hypothetical protein
MVEWSHKLSCNVNDILDIGNSPIAYKFLLCYGTFPEFPLQSPPVLPRPRQARSQFPETRMP